ncbi:MAG: NUDIX hydrolase [Meiothermus sp.]|uniref:NUDIX domain-containing protein n=1 Tax=Meiothermus sp. TaxID=1955249 RepID=UPI0025DEF7E1|nr:NUDIX hydrolase [Meiothermus sp.]MCS7057606.1 NUDIX hydrolase [Meiothermus sp.]MCS7193958.1 NUDIX hydrolase [Meiothermus sp.]MCX7740382.1 NUDIX hydrolase [Meiothermus sp.]MDW8090756.1 NUDIX hydrolase [Meiothermus sp.]MDW8480820.1 NUDIX hydrolase [Meiothermus sp.]
MPSRHYLYRGRILNLAIENGFEVVEHDHAVAILAECDGKLLFVRQHRPAVGGSTLELPAGLIHRGETPLEAALRELAEETQLSGELEFLNSFYVSPGFCNEKVFLFRAKDLRPARGTPDPDEQISVEWHDPKEVYRAAQAGREQISAPAMAGILYYLLETAQRPV